MLMEILQICVAKRFANFAVRGAWQIAAHKWAIILRKACACLNLEEHASSATTRTEDADSLTVV